MPKKFWIKKAVGKRPGAFRAEVQRTFGSSGFNPRTGAIDKGLEERLAYSKCPVCWKDRCICPTSKTRKRARLALTLRGFT